MVGAGVAGIAAANALQTAGTDVVVLEARNRIGGRIHTVSVGGVTVDAGASWIHGPVGNPLSELAERMSLRCKPFSIGQIFADLRLVDHDGAALQHAARDLVMDTADRIESLLSDRARSVGRDVTVADLLSQSLGEIRDAGLQEWVEFVVRTGLEADLATGLERMSAANFWVTRKYGGGDVCLEGGYVTMISRLAAGLDIRFNAAAVDIGADDAGVSVRCADGRVERGSHVVITVPLGVLKARSITFRPALPAEKSAAIDRLGFGTFEKLIFGFDVPFWHGESTPGGWLLRSHPVFPYWIDLTPVTGVPTLAAHVSGPPADELLQLSHEVAVAMARDAIGTATGCKVPHHSWVHCTRWRMDPFSRGSYSHRTPACLPQDSDVLAEPVAGRILFAGEATSRDRFGYVDGALETGLREASRIMGGAAARLSIGGVEA